jgi:hypothetical protein
MSTGPDRRRQPRTSRALLSSQGPSAEALRRPASVKLENCTEPKKWVNSQPPCASAAVLTRQDVEGKRWMPWHQEPKKDVDGCDKPRVGAEQPLIRGSPNGKTRRR